MDRRSLIALSCASSVAFFAPCALGAGPKKNNSLSKRFCLLVELAGGNDGLNTVIPYSDPLYTKQRQQLAISPQEILPLDENLGLHPAMEPLMGAWLNGDMASVVGLGHPIPSRSHFRSGKIWDTAFASCMHTVPRWSTDDVKRQQTRTRPKKCSTTRTNASNTLMSLRQWLLTNHSDVSRASRRKLLSANDFPAGHFGQNIKVAAAMLLEEVATPVIKVKLSGFDTHTGQMGRHSALLQELSCGLAAFRNIMIRTGMWDRVLIATYSEFGRQVTANGSLGTDHGTAAAHLVLGGNVKGGIYGVHPSLNDLDGNNLKHTTDFRQYLATIARDYLDFSGAFSAYTSMGFITRT